MFDNVIERFLHDPVDVNFFIFGKQPVNRIYGVINLDYARNLFAHRNQSLSQTEPVEKLRAQIADIRRTAYFLI
jgi:hypothetical protein